MVYVLRLLALFCGCMLRPFRRRRRGDEPIRCLLVGFSGANNTGAEAHTVEAIAQMRRTTGDRLHITVTSLDRARSLRYLNEDAHLTIAEVHSLLIIDMVRLVLRSDVVVLVEGYCFMEYFSPVLFWFFMFAADLAQRIGLPTAAYAVDAGHLGPGNARWARTVADRMDLVMMRTEEAASALKRIGVTRDIAVTADTAFSIEPCPTIWAEKTFVEAGLDRYKPVIGIAFEEFFWWPVVPRLGAFMTGHKADRYRSIYYHSWTHEGRARSRAIREAVAHFADWAWRELDAAIALFSMDRINAGPCRDVMRMMSRPAVLFDADRYDAREMTALLRSLKLLVASDYHGLILSMGAGVPVIGLGHDERIQSLMAELGLEEEYYIHYREDNIEDKLKQKSQLLLLEEELVRRRIRDALPGYMKRMAENGEHFAELVNKRFSPFVK